MRRDEIDRRDLPSCSTHYFLVGMLALGLGIVINGIWIFSGLLLCFSFAAIYFSARSAVSGECPTWYSRGPWHIFLTNNVRFNQDLMSLE
jgi:hypothetical protein